MKETWSVHVWIHFNNIQPYWLNIGLLLKHTKRQPSFKNYTSFPIYYLKWQSDFEILTSSYIMIWVRSNYVTGNKWISAMPYWKMCEKKYDKSYAATFYFSGSWVICSLKISGVRQIFITFFLFEKIYYVEMLSCLTV